MLLAYRPTSTGFAGSTSGERPRGRDVGGGGRGPRGSRRARGAGSSRGRLTDVLPAILAVVHAHLVARQRAGRVLRVRKGCGGRTDWPSAAGPPGPCRGDRGIAHLLDRGRGLGKRIAQSLRLSVPPGACVLRRRKAGLRSQPRDGIQASAASDWPLREAKSARCGRRGRGAPGAGAPGASRVRAVAPCQSIPGGRPPIPPG